MHTPQGTTTLDWPTLSDELLHGLIHALNNRVAALGAFVELSRLGDEEEDAATALSGEVVQLQQLSGLLALLPARRSNPEALEPRLVMDDALRLHEHHPKLRTVRGEVAYEGASVPVRVPRWAMLRVLVIFIDAAKRADASVQGHGSSPVVVRSDDATVSVRVGTTVEPSADLVGYAERCGGAVAQERGELVFRLPSVTALRRREREAREESSPS